ncbi:MAG: hypothetical protein V1761_01315 [bacterium]
MLTKTDRIITGIPVSEYRDEAVPMTRGICFLIHGHTGRKDYGHLRTLPDKLAAIGYFVVGVDAYKHGLRKEEPYHTGTGRDHALAMPEVIEHTCLDLKQLYESTYAANHPVVSCAGISMGGHIAFQMPKYLSMAMIAPFIGTPDLYRHYAVTKQNLIGLEELASLKSRLERLEIGPDYTAYMTTSILIQNAIDDPVVDYRYVVDFYDEIVRAGHDKIDIALYPGGHEMTDDMEDALVSWLTENN